MPGQSEPAEREPAEVSSAVSERPDSPAVGEYAGPDRKRPYSQPALQSYGSLVDVTRFGGSQLLDSGSNLQNP